MESFGPRHLIRRKRRFELREEGFVAIETRPPDVYLSVSEVDFLRARSPRDNFEHRPILLQHSPQSQFLGEMARLSVDVYSFQLSSLGLILLAAMQISLSRPLTTLRNSIGLTLEPLQGTIRCVRHARGHLGKTFPLRTAGTSKHEHRVSN